MEKFSRKNLEKVLDQYFTDTMIDTIVEELEYLEKQDEIEETCKWLEQADEILDAVMANVKKIDVIIGGVGR